jgi:hypothetical protein
MTETNSSRSIANSDLDSWRGFGEIWTRETYDLCLRRSVRVTVKEGIIEVVSPKKTIRFSTDEIVEVRMFRWPVPSMTLVFKQGSGHALVTLFCFSARRQNQFAEASGRTMIDRRLWRTGLEAARDQNSYALEGSSS